MIVHRDGALKSRTVRLPVWLARGAAGVALAVGILLVLGVAFFGPLARTAARVPFLEREVNRLTEENARVTGLADALERAERRYTDLRTVLGADVLPALPQTGGDRVQSALPIRARPPGVAPLYEAGATPPRHWPLASRQGYVTRGQVGPGGDEETHVGLDIAVPVGTPVRASGGGTVADAGRDPEYGLFVLLSHPGGYETMYGHASRILVRHGDAVDAGEVIALSGNTGRSTAPHLHFEIRRNGRSLDPMSMLKGVQ